MDTQDTIGKILTGKEERDAIHIAVLPVTATKKLTPGDNVGKDGNYTNPIGIVDPYLKHPVEPGQTFWLFLYPKTITSLRHVWTHPDLSDLPDKVVFGQMSSLIDITRSKKWIEDYANSIGLGYDQLLRDTDAYLQHGDYACYGGLLEGEYTDPDYWDHYEVVTNTKVATKDRENFFTCSC